MFLPVILSYIGPAAHAPALLPSDLASKHKNKKDDNKKDPEDPTVQNSATVQNVEKAKTNNDVQLIRYENRVDDGIVEYKISKDFVSRSEFRAIPTVS